MRKCMKHFADLLSSRDTCIYVHTYEENEFIKDVADILNGNSEYTVSVATEEDVPVATDIHATESDRKKVPATIYVYSRFEGLYTIDKNEPEIYARRKYIEDVKNVAGMLRFIRDKINGSMSTDSFRSILSAATEQEDVADTQKEISIFILKDLHLFMDKDTIRAIRCLYVSFV